MESLEQHAAIASRVRRRQITFWSFQIIFWLALGCALVGVTRAFRPNEPTPWRLVTIRVATGFFASSCVHWFMTSRFIRNRTRPMKWTLAAGAAGVVTLVYVFVLSDRVMPLIIPATDAPLPASLLPRVFGAGVWYAIYLGLDLLEDAYEADIRRVEADRQIMASELRAVQAESLARENEVRHLQAQMNPHFLFNALNAVVASRHDPDAVERVTQDLGDYLRFALQEPRPLEPLARELQSLEKYLSIQQTRFGENLICRIQCDQTSYSVAVPPMMLQPLLENAFVHGPQTSPKPLTVTVKAAVNDGWLEAEVANTGSWVAPDPTRRPSTGIQTLRKRLRLLVGEEATVTTSAEDGWVRVAIRMPARPVPAPVLQETSL